MKKELDSFTIKNLEINPDKKVCVCVSGEDDFTKNLKIKFRSVFDWLPEAGEYLKAREDVVTMSKTHPDDEFDPYVGSALAICYNLFGSKTQFYKYVDSVIKECDTKRELKQQKDIYKKIKNSSKVEGSSTTKRGRGRPRKDSK